MEHLGQIEERIRCLEAVVFRARQRQRQRPSHAPIQVTNYAGELGTVADLPAEEERLHQEFGGIDVGGEMVGDGRTCKRKASYLVAKALGVEPVRVRVLQQICFIVMYAWTGQEIRF